jgi:2-isopropylmalate synthase
MILINGMKEQFVGNKIAIYDTTMSKILQWSEPSISAPEKINIVQKLDRLGVAYIEVGSPNLDDHDGEFYQHLRGLSLKNAKLAVVGAICEDGSDSTKDPCLRAMVEAGTPVCSVNGTAWKSLDLENRESVKAENLVSIKNSLLFLQSKDRELIFAAEHFFDGYKEDPAYALKSLETAVGGGAETVVLCDTQGSALPWEVGKIVSEVRQVFPDLPLGIRPHNDWGCAVANVVAGVGQGVVHVQGAINGYGGRAGVANLCNIIPDLELKMGFACLPAGQLPELLNLSRYLAELVDHLPDRHMPYVGKSAFAPL